MKKNHPIKETLERIHTTETYEMLDQFKHPAKWKNMAQDDLHLLANLFIKKGSLELNKNIEQAEESFETAVKLTGHEGAVLLKISRLWASVEDWDRAISVLKVLLEKESHFLEGWLELSALYVIKGKTLRDEDQYIEALRVFDRLSAGLNILPPEVFFKWGQVYQCLGKLSQEPCDLTHACEKYQRAEELGFVDKYLFYDHAIALSELATLLARVDFVQESLLYLLKSVEIDPHFHEGWVYLAITYHFLYEKGGKSEYYDRAESAFYTASRLDPRHKPLWLSWGQMLLSQGRITRNHEVVSLAIEKFERALSLFPNDRDVQCFLADALMVLGLFEERYELLKEAKDKIEECLRIKPDDAATLFLYGTCLVHLGKYFRDENLICQSFDKFEKSIQINPKDPHVWHSLGLAHFSYGEMTEDPIMLEKAIHLYENTQKLMKQADSELFNNWGVALMKLSEVTGDLLPIQIAADKFEQAIAYHQSTREGQDPDPEWYYNYGCALDYLGDFYQDPGFYETSAQVLGHLVQSFPTYSQARYNLALALTHLGDSVGDIEALEHGLRHFEQLLQEDHEDEAVLADMGVALIALGDLMVAAESFSEGKNHYQSAENKLLQAVALGSKGAFYWLACLYSLNGNFSDCLHFLERARDNEALPTREELSDEKWLEAFREMELWPHFLETLPED